MPVHLRIYPDDEFFWLFFFSLSEYLLYTFKRIHKIYCSKTIESKFISSYGLHLMLNSKFVACTLPVSVDVQTYQHTTKPQSLFYLVYYLHIQRCPWCNCYRRRKLTRRHGFKSWTRLIAFHIALIPLGKVWIQLFSIQLWANSRADLVLQPWLGN